MLTNNVQECSTFRSDFKIKYQGVNYILKHEYYKTLFIYLIDFVDLGILNVYLQ